jgi:circadian clock protein KaiC
MERIPSGHPNLDRVLDGGLPAHNITMILGLPGTGKTILAQQYAFANATADRPSVYLSTVSEPFDKILRYGQSLSFFDASAIGRSVFYEDLGADLHVGGVDLVLKRVEGSIKDRRPGVLVIDSFKALRAYADTDGQFRHFLHDLAGRVTASPMTSFWIGEYDQSEIGHAPEFAVADAVISLTSPRVAQRETRALQVLKLRGSSFLPGEHAYRLTPEGIRVFPRLADPADPSAYPISSDRDSSGIAALDEMLGEGYWAGASTLLAGPSGSGKTLMGLHFLFNGARMGQPGLLATLQENPTQLARIVGGFGWSLDDDRVHLMYRPPVDLYLDEWVSDLLETSQRVGARRILIDSLGDLQWASPDETRFREYAYSLLNRCSRTGVSVMMTYEIPQLFGVTQLSDVGGSHLSDNVVLLQFVREGSRIRRALAVMKTRASEHQPEIREFLISSDGIVLGDEIALDQRVGEGVPHASRPSRR